MHFKNKKALTLVELLVATTVFTIAFAGLMIGQRSSRYISEGALVRFVTNHYAQGLLEAVQSYYYEDPGYPQTGNIVSDSSTAFLAHTQTFGTFSGSESGVTDEDNNLIRTLPEDRIGLKYFSTEVESDMDPLSPFSKETTLQPNTRLLGPENSDLHALSDPSAGKYFISEDQQKINIFAQNGTGQERYYFVNDVDDFDGYTEEREILPGVVVVFEVSVSGVYGNIAGYPYTIRNALPNDTIVAQGTLAQEKFAPMYPTSINNFQTLIPALLSSNDALSQTQQLAYGYYQSMIFKKITIKATWEYPIGSGKTNTIVVDGGKVNPGRSVL